MKALLLAPLLVALAACTRHQPLPVLGEVPDFHLTAQDGRPFDRSALEGKIWVANFIYTTCSGPCPIMSSKMRRLQDRSRATLVSFTVDPRRDTPSVLAGYAHRYAAQPGRWHFLTGSQQDLNALGLKGFKLNSVDGNLDHSTRFVLVDRHNRIRGYYLASEEHILDRLAADIRRLEKEP